MYDILVISIIFTLNMIGISLFLRYARKRKLLDKPNNRSSHQIPTIRGGGLMIAPCFFVLIIWLHPAHYLIAIAVLVAAIISFIDDLRGLPVRLRLIVHLLAVTLILIDLPVANNLLFYGCALILLTGWINTFNFMDGINGISAIYAIVLLLSLLSLNLSLESNFPYTLLNLCMVFSIMAFAFFNFRKKALCFAGDVGSISLALILAWMFFQTWTAEFFFLLVFPAIYAVDSVMTILVRLKKGENIFKAHRSHLYQLFANEQKVDHRIIATIYGVSQLLINIFGILYLRFQNLWTQILFVLIIYLILCVLYFLLRKYIIKFTNIEILSN